MTDTPQVGILARCSIEIEYDVAMGTLTWRVQPAALHPLTVLQVLSTMLSRYTQQLAAEFAGRIVGPSGFAAATQPVSRPSPTGTDGEGQT